MKTETMILILAALAVGVYLFLKPAAAQGGSLSSTGSPIDGPTGSIPITIETYL